MVVYTHTQPPTDALHLSICLSDPAEARQCLYRRTIRHWSVTSADQGALKAGHLVAQMTIIKRRFDLKLPAGLGFLALLAFSVQISRSIRSTCKLTSTGGDWLEINAPGTGTWGGECTCPSGQTYLVSDEGNACSTLACVGGKYTGCERRSNPIWAHRRVHCAQMETLAYESSSEPVLIAPPLSALPIASPPPVSGPPGAPPSPAPLRPPVPAPGPGPVADVRVQERAPTETGSCATNGSVAGQRDAIITWVVFGAGTLVGCMLTLLLQSKLFPGSSMFLRPAVSSSEDAVPLSSKGSGAGGDSTSEFMEKRGHGEPSAAKFDPLVDEAPQTEHKVLHVSSATPGAHIACASALMTPAAAPRRGAFPEANFATPAYNCVAGAGAATSATPLRDYSSQHWLPAPLEAHLPDGQRQLQGPTASGDWQVLTYLPAVTALRFEIGGADGRPKTKMQVLGVSMQRWTAIAMCSTMGTWQAAVDRLLHEATHAQKAADSM